MTAQLRNGLYIQLVSRNDIPILWEVFGDEIYAPIPENTRVIVDLGANLGCFTLYALKHVPQAKVYAYEPSSKNFKTLSRNIALNHLGERVSLRREAVSSQKGEVVLHLSTKGDSGHHSLEKREGVEYSDSEVVPCTTLDAIIEEVGDIDFLKIDVEGAEYDLLGACNTLHRVKTIAVEGKMELLQKIINRPMKRIKGVTWIR